MDQESAGTGHPLPGLPAAGDVASAGPGCAATAPGYASWSRRVLAGLLDRLLTIPAAALLLGGYGQSLAAAAEARSLAPDWRAGSGLLSVGTALLLVALLSGAVNRWWRQGRTGRSLGKQALGLTLLGTTTGCPVGVRHAVLRDLVHALDALTVVGYLWPLWDPRRQTLADKLTRTMVTRSPGAT